MERKTTINFNSVLLSIIIAVVGYVAWNAQDTRERLIRIEVGQGQTVKIVDDLSGRVKALEKVMLGKLP